MQLATWLAQATPEFPEQLTTNLLLQNLIYASGTVGAIMILAGLLMVDVGGVRRVNVFAAAVEKMVGFFIGFVVYFLIGFAIWNWQYYVAFDVADPYWQAIKDWWLGRHVRERPRRERRPGEPGRQPQQPADLHLLPRRLRGNRQRPHPPLRDGAHEAGGVLRHLRRRGGGLLGPLLADVGIDRSAHECRLPRLLRGRVRLPLPCGDGARARAQGRANDPACTSRIRECPSTARPTSGLTTAGVAVIFAGLPMVILSCLFFFAPEGVEALAVSVTMADTSVGIAFNNLGLAWAGGALTGAAIAYWKRSYIYLLLGPLGGYVACAVAFDVYKPWQTLLVAMGAPIVCYAVYEFSQARRWDEHKLTPLFLGAGSYGIIMVGLVSWGTDKGGYFGLTEGDYAFQNAEINVFWQLLGLIVLVGSGVVTRGCSPSYSSAQPGFGSRRRSKSRASTPATGISSVISDKHRATAFPLASQGLRRRPHRRSRPETETRSGSRGRARCARVTPC